MARVLITGPVENLADYAEAARGAGWEAHEFPLLAIEPRAFEPAQIGSPCFDWIAVTSPNACAWLTSARAHAAELARVPCVVVGERSAARVAALGFAITGPAARGADDLARDLIERAERGARVLWPRGSATDELAALLREGGLDVVDPIAYHSRLREAGDRPPRCEAVFFASPSSVRAWTMRTDPDAQAIENAPPPAASAPSSDEGDHPRTAIAIGSTTFAALLGETVLPFFDTISLPEPTPEALAFVLAHLDAGRTP